MLLFPFRYPRNTGLSRECHTPSHAALVGFNPSFDSRLNVGALVPSGVLPFVLVPEQVRKVTARLVGTRHDSEAGLMVDDAA